jgi:hypothetical protein
MVAGLVGLHGQNVMQLVGVVSNFESDFAIDLNPRMEGLDVLERAKRRRNVAKNHVVKDCGLPGLSGLPAL